MIVRMRNHPPQISICIATYRRTDRLQALLGDLAVQELLPQQVVVVDNEVGGGARQVVEKFRSSVAFPVEYDVQPVPSIAVTRNRTVELAFGEWLAFIDDDERAPPHWLRRLVDAAETFKADGVLAPVEPRLPDSAPSWLRRGRFYDFPRQLDGSEVPLNRMRFGNVLLRGDRLRALPGPFDSTLGLEGGEDVDLLVRLARAGARIVWYNQAPVYEPVEPKRLSLRWLLLRAYSGGQGFARYTVDGGFGAVSALAKVRFFVRAFLQLMVALITSVIALPAGRHAAAAWLIKASANAGKITVLWRARYRAYARN
jgi:succinoglycan biosynthesis protein ExoM